MMLPWLRKRYRYKRRFDWTGASQGLHSSCNLWTAFILSNSAQFHPCFDWHGLLCSRYIAGGKTTNLFSNHHLERLAFHPQLKRRWKHNNHTCSSIPFVYVSTSRGTKTPAKTCCCYFCSDFCKFNI